MKTGKVPLYFDGDGDKDKRCQRLQQFYDIVLTAAAKIRQRSLDDTWKAWFTDFLKYIYGKYDERANSETITDFLGSTTPADNNGINEDRSFILSLFSETVFALVDDGWVLRCIRRETQEQFTVKDHQVYAFKGSPEQFVLSQESGDEHRYVGFLHEPRATLDEDFFSQSKIEQIALI